MIPMQSLPPDSRLWWLLAPLYAAWLPPQTSSPPVFAAGAVLCLAFFMTSVWIEARSARTRVPLEQALAWAKRANALTYGPVFIALAMAALLSS